MSSVEKYELLKTDGTRINRIKYILSLPDKNQIEQHLKQSSATSYDDLVMLIFLSTSTKNAKNLLEIFKTDSLPVEQRAHAAKSWLKLIKDEKQVSDFITESINDKNIPRFLKHQILKSVHRIKYLTKSPSFIYDLILRLTETNNHHQYNMDIHLVPFCSKDQIIDLFSRWSIKRLEQVESKSAFYFKLMRYQPLIFFHLIKSDLNEKKNDMEKFSNYFPRNGKVFGALAKKQAKELVDLTIEYLNQLEKNKRLLPEFIELNQTYFYKKVPDQMIELMTIVASNQPGKIKYRTSWHDEGSELSSFELPRSFSVENHVRLFSALYDTCKWSTNNTIKLLHHMISTSNEDEDLQTIKKQRKWLFDIVIKQRIGKDLFLKKLLKEGNENTLKILAKYPELTTPLSLRLITQYERKGVVEPKQRLSLLRYQLMTHEIFDAFLSLFKQTGSDVNQRVQNYPLLFQCALSSNEQFVQKVLQWIEKRFSNEQLMVIENFLSALSSSARQFPFETLLNNFESIDTIINIAINHLQQSTKTLEIIISYGLVLLQHAEYCSNKEQREKIQAFAVQFIKRCYSKNENLTVSLTSLSDSYPQSHHIMVDILTTIVFPKLVSKSMINQIDALLSSYITKAWRLPQTDSFLNSFFTEFLPSSTKLQSAFKIDTHSSMIELFLRKKSTRFDRVKLLIEIDQVFFINENVQRIILLSQQHRQLIDQLIQDDKCVTLDKLTTEQSRLTAVLNSQTKNIKLPGFIIDLLICCSHLLTGKQQEHITRIIRNDYLQDEEVSNLNKLKSLRVLRRMTHTYDETIKWIYTKQDSQLAITNTNASSGRLNRGADAQPLDDLIICLPATFDLTSENLLKHLELLKTKLNSSNAKYISDAMLSISRKIPDQIFLKYYLELIRDEQFQKLGVTVNKEILRLLTEYVSDSSLVKSVIKPFWDSQPHQDVRACLVLVLLYFVGKSNSNDDETMIWEILEKAADDEYLPVLQPFFSTNWETSRWPLSHVKNSSHKTYEKFVNQIQFKILDHPTSLQARVLAWTYVDDEHCDTNKLIKKAQQICIQFDKDGDALWSNAFQKIVSCYKQQKIPSSNVVIDVIQKIMSCREELDSKQNAIDNQHDLPVYHRIQQILTILRHRTDEFYNEKKNSFRSLTSVILQFDKTLAPLMATLLVKIAQSKEDLEQVLGVLEKDLPSNYFERILTQLSTVLKEGDSCPFIQQLNPDEKLELAKWFINEKDRSLLVFDLLKTDVFNQPGIDRKQCQNLLRQIRQNENLFLRQEAMEYTVPWKDDVEIDNDDDQMSVSGESAMS